MGSICRRRCLLDSGLEETNGGRDPTDGTGGDGFDGERQSVGIAGHGFKTHGYIGQSVEGRDGDAIPGYHSTEVRTCHPGIGSMAQAPSSLAEGTAGRKYS